ncbi:MAG: STAS domain-containing protein [Actinomycetota bacterium]|nr:STAS domain-containing protein [Actinomycetota bacterium]
MPPLASDRFSSLPRIAARQRAREIRRAEELPDRREPGSNFSVDVRPFREHFVVVVCGEVDLLTAPEVHETVTDAVADGWRKVVVDLRAVSFMDASGVHLLQSLNAMRQHGVHCRMMDGAPAVRDILQLLALTDVLPHIDPATL